jgi:hypothetical protein
VLSRIVAARTKVDLMRIEIIIEGWNPRVNDGSLRIYA